MVKDTFAQMGLNLEVQHPFSNSNLWVPSTAVKFLFIDTSDRIINNGVVWRRSCSGPSTTWTQALLRPWVLRYYSFRSFVPLMRSMSIIILQGRIVPLYDFCLLTIFFHLGAHSLSCRWETSSRLFVKFSRSRPPQYGRVIIWPLPNKGRRIAQ